MLTGTLFGHRMIQGELLRQFGEEQSGSRKNKDCQDVQLLKHCIFSCVRLSRANGSTFDNDAKSCFDRIVMILPSILAQRLGMPAKVCDLFLAVLAQTHYHTKTIHGISEQSHTSTDTHTIHGPGQGSRAAPAIWTIISCFLLSLMREKSQGVSLQDPERSLTFHQSSSGFVDDITHWNLNISDSLAAPETPETLSQTTSTLAQWWENLLHSSGGKLELTKCFFYTFQWQFDENGSATFAPSALVPPVSIIDSVSGEQTTIEHKECSQSHKTLGKMENPSGNYDDEAQRIREKADGYGHYVAASGLNRLEAYILYIRMFLPSICYGFASGTMSIAQSEKAQSHAMLAFLPKLGYCRNTPRDVIYAEPKWGGSGMRHLFAEQGTKQVQAVLRHIRSRSELGNALTIQLRWAQKIGGLSLPILTDTARRLPHLADERWISTLRLFLNKSRLSLHLLSIPTTVPNRENDRCIMDIVTNASDYTPHSIIMINRCRIHLRAEYISDLTDACGTALTNNAKECILDAKAVHAMWPTQPRPQNQKPWKLFLRRICSAQAGILDQPLGCWNKGALSRKWLTYFDSATNTAIFRINNVWVSADIRHHMPTKWTLRPHTPLPQNRFTPAQSCIPVTRYHHEDSISISIPHIPVPVPIQEFVSWHDFLLTLPAWERILLLAPTVHEPLLLRRALMQYSATPIMIVSDGSTKDKYGAYGWEMELHSDTLVSCYASTNGIQTTPLRSECFGVLSWAIFLIRYCEFHQIQPTMSKIQPYSDSELAIKYSVQSPTASSRTKPLRADFDVTVSLSYTFAILREKFPMLFPITHIKGHTKEYASSAPTLLLHKVDLLTKARRKLQLNAPAINFHHCGAYLERDGGFISRSEINICRWSWRNDVLFIFYAKKFRVEAPRVQRINWGGYSGAKSTLSPSMQRFSVKLTIGWLPVGERIKYYGNEIDVCHLCPARETPFHLFQCPHRFPYFFERHTAFRQLLVSIGTPQAMIPPLSDGILFWATSASHDRITQARATLHPDILQCVLHQDSKGWSIATFGVMDQSWSMMIPDPNDMKLGDKWQAKVSGWLIQQAHVLWTTRNCERNNPDPTILMNAKCRETEAQVARVFATMERLLLSEFTK